MSQDPREHLILDALYRKVPADEVERAEDALGEIVRERDAFRRHIAALIVKYDHSGDECEGECVPDRNAVVADLRALLAEGEDSQEAPS